MSKWKESLVSSASNRELAWHVAVALEQLVGRESALIKLGANERALAHRLAVYLESSFPSWHIDCEYNREGESKKRNSGGSLVLPDVIVHRRMTNENLLAIEPKTRATSEQARIDLEKLRDYRRKQGFQPALSLNLESVLADSKDALESVYGDQE